MAMHYLSQNLEFFMRIINNSKKDKLFFKAVLSISPKILLQGYKMNYPSKLRIVSEACFRSCNSINGFNLNYQM